MSLRSQTKGVMLRVDLECKQVPTLLSIFELVSFTKLETSEESLIRQINRISYINNKYYLYANRRCNIFSSEGKYLKGIGKMGRGPGEMVSPIDCSIIPGISEAAFLDNRLRRITIYDFEGNHLRNRTPGIAYLGHLERVSMDEFIVTTYIEQKAEQTGMPEDFNNSCAYYYNIETKKVEAIVKFPDNPAVIKVENTNTFYKYNNNTYFRPPFSNNIYKFCGENPMENVISIDFGKYTLDEEDESYKLSPQKILYESGMGKIVLLYAFLEMKDLYYLVYMKENDFYIHLISKETNKQVRYNVKNRLDVLRNCLPLFVSNDNIMASLDPAKYITSYKNLELNSFTAAEVNKLNDLRKDLLPEDNPVVLILKPKF